MITVVRPSVTLAMCVVCADILTPVYEDISPHGRHWMTESYGFVLKVCPTAGR